VERLHTLAGAEEAFFSICNVGYADLEGLVDPSTAVADYPRDGPSFLPESFRDPEHDGYRFELRVEEPLPGSEGCPTRTFRSYVYSARPVGGRGAHFVIGPDGRVHRADDRAATLDDPPLSDRQSDASDLLRSVRPDISLRSGF
jgi:hypothetical protein